MRTALALLVLTTSALAAEPPPDRVLVLSSESVEYRQLAIRPSIRTNADAGVRLVVFQAGLCVLDRGLIDAQRQAGSAPEGRLLVEQTGTIERAASSDDLSAAIVVTTAFASRVDVTPGVTSTDGDTVRAATTITLVDPAHPEGRWQRALEDGRWIRDLVALSAGSGAALTSFVPRNGPTDFRVFDANGRQVVRIPDERGETVALAAAPGGEVVAADLKFRDSKSSPERGVTVFDLVKGTSWTYGWRYGSDDEPVSWSLEPGGALSVKLPAATHRFDRGGKRL